MRSFSNHLAEQTKPKFSSSEFDVPGVTIKRNKFLDAPAPKFPSRGPTTSQIQADIARRNKEAYAATAARVREVQQAAADRLSASEKKGGLFGFGKKPEPIDPAEKLFLQRQTLGVEGLPSGRAIPDRTIELLVPGGIAARGASKVAPRATKLGATALASALGGREAAKDITREVQAASDVAWKDQQKIGKGLASALTFGQAKVKDAPSPKIKFRDVIKGVGQAFTAGRGARVTAKETGAMLVDPRTREAAKSGAIQAALVAAKPVAGLATQLPQFAKGTAQARRDIADVDTSVPPTPEATSGLAKILGFIQRSAIEREQKK